MANSSQSNQQNNNNNKKKDFNSQSGDKFDTKKNQHSGGLKPEPKQQQAESNKPLDDAKEVVLSSKDSIEDLIRNGRELAMQYSTAKRGEIEHFVEEFIKGYQGKLETVIDESLEKFSGSFEKFLDRNKSTVTTFVTDFGKSVQSGIKQIEAKPLFPIFAALIGGTIAGMFLAGKRDFVPQISSSLKKKVKDTTSGLKKAA